MTKELAPHLFVTGGSRGIGAAIAKMAAKRGFAVSFTYRNADAEAQKVKAACEKLGASCFVLKTDAGDLDQIPGVFEEVEKANGPITVFSNNAGVINSTQPLTEISTDEIERIFKINLTSAFVHAREAAKRMTSRGQGVIVNTSSRASGLNGAGGFLPYGASKAGVDVLTNGLALEVADKGVRVVGILPGMIDTDIQRDTGVEDRMGKVTPSIPMKRGGTADEVAQAVLWLASDEAGYITGDSIKVSGGR